MAAAMPAKPLFLQRAAAPFPSTPFPRSPLPTNLIPFRTCPGRLNRESCALRIVLRAARADKKEHACTFSLRRTAQDLANYAVARLLGSSGFDTRRTQILDFGRSGQNPLRIQSSSWIPSFHPPPARSPAPVGAEKAQRGLRNVTRICASLSLSQILFCTPGKLDHRLRCSLRSGCTVSTRK